tara:strand:- start:759 stop:1163 length:405 start_codon:yes stop_codon:yes gene_type:complete
MNLLIFLDLFFTRTIGVICITIIILLALYNYVWKLTSEPIENEEIKKYFLEKKFEHEITILKNDEFSATIRAERPHTNKKQWYVWKTTDRGYQGSGSFKTQEKDYELLKIYDHDLNDLIESKEAKDILKEYGIE